MPRRSARCAFTLVEVLLVVALLAVLAGLVLPVMFGELDRRRLTESAEQLRSLVVMTRANAMTSGQRHRIRWDEQGQQPVVEREADPIGGPGQFTEVQAAWARENVLLGSINCHEVRLGWPAESDAAAQEQTEEEARSTLLFEPTGECEWATFVLAPGDLGEMPEGGHPLWVVLDGRTGGVSVKPAVSAEELAAAQVDREKLLRPLADRQIVVEEQAAETGQASQTGQAAQAGQAEGTGSEASELAQIEAEIKALEQQTGGTGR